MKVRSRHVIAAVLAAAAALAGFGYLWAAQIVGMALALWLMRSGGRPRGFADWACCALMVAVWLIPVAQWAIATVQALREARRRPVRRGPQILWVAANDPRTAHLGGFVSRGGLGEPEPLDLGRFNCRGEYVIPKRKGLVNGCLICGARPTESCAPACPVGLKGDA